MLTAAAGCPASSGVPGPRGYVAGHRIFCLDESFLDVCVAGYPFPNEMLLVGPNGLLLFRSPAVQSPLPLAGWQGC